MRNKITLISFEDPKENMDARMSLYQEAAGSAPIKAYVNIGGGTISVGTRIGKERFNPGLNRKPPADALEIDSVMTRFARMGIPLIHMTKIVTIAETYGLPKSPQRMPNVGEGDIFMSIEYNRILAAACACALLLIVYFLLKSDIGFRIFGSVQVSKSLKHPEPMV